MNRSSRRNARIHAASRIINIDPEVVSGDAGVQGDPGACAHPDG